MRCASIHHYISLFLYFIFYAQFFFHQPAVNINGVLKANRSWRITNVIIHMCVWFSFLLSKYKRFFTSFHVRQERTLVELPLRFFPVSLFLFVISFPLLRRFKYEHVYSIFKIIDSEITPLTLPSSHINNFSILFTTCTWLQFEASAQQNNQSILTIDSVVLFACICKFQMFEKISRSFLWIRPNFVFWASAHCFVLFYHLTCFFLKLLFNSISFCVLCFTAVHSYFSDVDKIVWCCCCYFRWRR